MLIKGENLAYSTYGTGNDYCMVIDQNGVIQYVKPGISISSIQSKIDELLSTPVQNNNQQKIEFKLYDNYPNPFNPETTIRFTLDEKQKINLNIFDLQGRLINQLVNRVMRPGEYTIRWNGINQNNKRVASGIYFYQLAGKNRTIVKKMQFLK